MGGQRKTAYNPDAGITPAGQGTAPEAARKLLRAVPLYQQVAPVEVAVLKLAPLFCHRQRQADL